MGAHARSGLVRIARNCWIEPSCAEDFAARCAAVLASVNADAAISSLSAARLHGLWLPREVDEIHVATAAPGRAGRSMTRTKRAPFIAHRLQLGAQDVTLLDGVAVTTPARTWRDLAGVLALPDLVAAGDSVLRLGGAVAELTDMVSRTARGRYSTRARAALPLLDGRSRSRPESHLRVAVSGPGMPRFAVNEAVHRDEGGWLAEPDLSLAAAKLALEYQGDEHAELRRMRSDITRQRDLRTDGWLCLLYGPREVFGRPWTIEPEVRDAIRERAPGLLSIPGRGGSRPRRVVRPAASGPAHRTTRAATDHSTGG